MHSAWYRRPGEFARHETVMVVGSGPSAMDLCTDSMCIMPLLLHTILASPSQIGVIYPDGNETYRKVGRVVKYRGGGSVLLEDGSIEFNIDLVIQYWQRATKCRPHSSHRSSRGFLHCHRPCQMSFTTRPTVSFRSHSIFYLCKGISRQLLLHFRDCCIVWRLFRFSKTRHALSRGY
jgi:hypothetical protein